MLNKMRKQADAAKSAYKAALRDSHARNAMRRYKLWLKLEEQYSKAAADAVMSGAMSLREALGDEAIDRLSNNPNLGE